MWCLSDFGNPARQTRRVLGKERIVSDRPSHNGKTIVRQQVVVVAGRSGSAHCALPQLIDLIDAEFKARTKLIAVKVGLKFRVEGYGRLQLIDFVGGMSAYNAREICKKMRERSNRVGT